MYQSVQMIWIEWSISTVIIQTKVDTPFWISQKWVIKTYDHTRTHMRSKYMIIIKIFNI